jgi:hypothetical protein
VKNTIWSDKLTSVNDKRKNVSLTERICILKEETRELETKLLSLLCMNDYLLDDKITLNVKKLSDGIDDTDHYFEKKIVSGDLNALSKSLSFGILPISEKLETYKYPLMLISDENEIDAYIRQRIIKRKENNLNTFPVLVFCDDFFTVREGESFGYISIIESIEQACGDNCRAMAFKASDMVKGNIYFNGYIDYLDMVLHLNKLKIYVEETFEYLDYVIDGFSIFLSDSSNEAPCKLSAIVTIRSYLAFRDDLANQFRILDEHIKKVNGILCEIRDKYDEHIYRIIRNEPLKKASSMAVHIGLKYDVFKMQLEDFLVKVSNSSLYNCDFLIRDTIPLVKESYKEINTNTSELTLIGTFSSGKTTMINTFLGHTHKLHTSKNHNTAVLMQIKKKPENEKNEFYEVIFKDKLVWSLAKPAYLETKLYRNPFDGQAKVLDIKNTEQCYIVKLKETSGEKCVQIVRIGKMHKLRISKNAVIEGRSSLIVTDASENELQLASKSEIQLLLDYVLNGKLIHPKITVYHKNGEKDYQDTDAINFLNRLSKCEKYNQVSRANRHPMVTKEHLSQLMGENIVFSTFFADILANDKKVKLDDKEWDEFCGNDKQEILTGGKVPFCEAPECYMLAEHINVYLDCEFLNYCSVNDTPGFGSITEEHDACTERFVSSSKSRLLAMITINSKSEDAKLYDFLNFIANIFQNYRKDQIGEVYFMLNCFSNNATEQKLQSDIIKISKVIKDLGFNKENIYVCDLRKSTEESQETRTMMEFPSYASFREKCVNNMLEQGVISRYSWVYDSWESYFKDNMNFIENRLYTLEDNLENGEAQIDNYKKKIKAVKAIKNPSIDAILSEAKARYDEFYDFIETTFCSTKKASGFLWKNRERREACIEIMDDIGRIVSAGELEEFSDDIKNVVLTSLNELEYESEIYLDDELQDSNSILFTLAIQNIKDKLLTADENTRWYNQSDQTHYYMNKIKDIIKEDYMKSSKRAKTYFDQLNQIYVSRKKQALHTLEEELKGIGNPDLIREQIRLFSNANKEVIKLKKEFEDTISTDALRKD